MAPIADRALADIRRITEPYRQIARWMESHPGRAYVAERWRLADPDTMLSSGEVAEAVGLTDRKTGFRWLTDNGIGRRLPRARRCYRLGDVEAVILRKQPKLPLPGTKLSDYLFLVPRHFLRRDLSTQTHTLDFVDDQKIRDFLGRSDEAHSVFKRFDILDADGKPYRINTKCLRHFLNTLAQEGLLSQLDIARWSGRKNVGQNAAYDHTGGVQLGREMRRILEMDGMEGPIVDTVESLPPADRDAFLKGRFATAHFTSIGACVQDFSLAPCPSHGACAGCSEHLVVKGKPAHRAEAERLLDEHEAMLAQAQAETDEGTFNASVWVAHNERMVDGLKKALAVHADDGIADGTVVQVWTNPLESGSTSQRSSRS
jgi:hypothetical protein